MSFPTDLSPHLIKKAAELAIKPEDIVEKHVVGGGKGGQKINKTASCVMLQHGPSGTLVKCQKHREQKRNRLSAYKLLILKIEDIVKGKQSERAQKIFKLRKQKRRRSKKAKEKVLAHKAHRSVTKTRRKPVKLDE